MASHACCVLPTATAVNVTEGTTGLVQRASAEVLFACNLPALQDACRGNAGASGRPGSSKAWLIQRGAREAPWLGTLVAAPQTLGL
jgi:hypothetical protein